MNLSEIINASIARSISHTERVTVEVDDLDAAELEVSAQADESDSCEENDGSMDVWGDMDGSEFRLRLVKTA